MYYNKKSLVRIAMDFIKFIMNINKKWVKIYIIEVKLGLVDGSSEVRSSQQSEKNRGR